MSTDVSRGAYVDAVGSHFLRLRGGGLTLSPVDADRIRAWHDRGLPMELVCAGLDAAHKALRDSGRARRPFHLRFADRWVEELAASWERRSLPPFESPRPREGGLERLLRAVREKEAASEGPCRAGWSAAAHALRRLADDPAAALVEADVAQAHAYLLALPPADRLPLVRRTMETLGGRRGVPRRTFRAMLRASLHAAARRHGNLVQPSDLL